MPSLTIKNIPNPVYKRLKAQAVQHRRSLTREVIACLEQASQSMPFEPEQILVKARSLRQHTQGVRLTDRTLRRLKTAGRP